MDSIGVQLDEWQLKKKHATMTCTEQAYRNIKDVESDTSHVLFGTNTFLRCPLERGNAGILDFIQILDPLGNINQQVRSCCIRTEGPNLPGIRNVPTILVSKDTCPSLEIITSADFTTFYCFRQLLVDGHRLHVETVVLVLRFR